MDSSNPNICFSGGASGADLAWGDVAKAAGHEVRHFVFKGHRGSNHPDAVIVSPEDLKVGDPVLHQVNLRLKRSFPAHSEFVTNLLRRNYWQVHSSQSVYAIGYIEEETGMLAGGTSWAVEAFKVLNPYSEMAFVFDQDEERWFFWDTLVDLDLDPAPFNPAAGLWSPIELPPKPSGFWTGIGSSKYFKPVGRLAIEHLFEEGVPLGT